MARFWVLGTGNWSDTAHWAASSGGAGGQSVPDATQAVTFDANSGTGICTVNTSARTCLSLTCTNYAGTLTLDQQLTAGNNGNITLGASMTLNGTGRMIMSGAGTLTTNGIAIPADFEISGGSPTIVLAGDVTVGGTLRLSSTTATTFSGVFSIFAAAAIVSGTQTITLSGSVAISGLTTISDANVINNSGVWWQTYGLTTTGNLTGTTPVYFYGTGTWTGAAGSLANNLVFFTGANTTISGTVLYTTGTISYAAGTVTTTGSTLSLGGSCTLDTPGVSWNNVTISAAATITINSPLTVTGTMTLPNAAVTFAGPVGFTVGTLTCTITATRTITLAAGVTYIVQSALSLLGGTASVRYTLVSSSGGTKAVLTLVGGASQDVKYADPTDIDSSGGQRIFTYKGVITTTSNWSATGTTTFMACASATYGVEHWTTQTGTVTIDSGTVFGTNPRSYKLNTSNPAVNAVLRKTAVVADAGTRFTFKVRFPDATPAAVSDIAFVQNASNVQIFSLRVTAGGILRLLPVGGTGVNGATVLQDNTPYRISVSYKITNTTTHEFRVYLNGVLEITLSNSGTMTNIVGVNLVLQSSATAGTDFLMYADEVHVDDGTDLADIGTSVAAKQPAADNTIGWDFPVGADPGAGSRFTVVNDRPLDITIGREHRGIAWVANSAFIAVDAANAAMAIGAPACVDNDILICALMGKDNVTHSSVTGASGAPWTQIGTQVNNTTAQTSSLWWKRAVAADSGATITATKASSNGVFFSGTIAAWKGCRINATPIDATAPSSSANASADAVTYATFNPTETSAFVVAVGTYSNDLTTAGAISGTNPTYTNRLDQENSTDSDCSFFMYDGESDGAATGARSHATTSTLDAINTGWQFGLVPTAQENYTLQARAVGDNDLTNTTILAWCHWVWAKKGASGTTGTPQIMVNGTQSAVTLTTSAAMYNVFTDSRDYPSNAAGIGMQSSGTSIDTYLYDCGAMLAYIPFVSLPPSIPVVKRPQFYKPIVRRY